MRIQTRGNSTTVWLSSDIGVIDGTMTMSAPTLEKILQAVNEKYGTSFEGWSQLPSAYEVGDNVPSWDAYEKIGIELVNGFYKYDISGGQNVSFVAMQCENGFLKLYVVDVPGDNSVIIYDSAGNVRTSAGRNTLIEEVQAKAELYSNYQGIERMIKDQDAIANWSEYKLL